MATLEKLRTKFGDQADTADAIAELMAFTSIAVTGVAIGGGSLTLAAVLVASAKAAGAALKFAKILVPKGKDKFLKLDNADRIDDIFYVLAQKSYLQALKSLKGKLPEKSKVNKKLHKDYVNDLSRRVVKPDRAEASFEFGWQPDSGPLHLFASYTQWMHILLISMGAKEEESLHWLNDVELIARKELFLDLAMKKKERSWLLDYQLLNDNARILDLLKGFTDPKSVPNDSVWKNYMADIVQRPLNSIWGEKAEGVCIKKLFVEPSYNYARQHHAGLTHYKPVAALVNFVSGLLSLRRPSTELIFLMGGPGSGKTSAMEMLCASLAEAALTPIIFIPAKRIDPKKGIMHEILEYLGSIGYQAVGDMLSTSQDCIIAIDGFDELAHATLSSLEAFFRDAQDLVRERSGSKLRIILSGRPTLFSNNDVCIPVGSHIISLEPFNAERVKLWSEKWRELKGGDFDGEIYNKSKSQDIRELSSQPMLLYLMAKMHEEEQSIPVSFGKTRGTKFLVYERILNWVCKRQIDKGVADDISHHMRRFLQIAGLATHQSGQRILHWHYFAGALKRFGLADDTKEVDSKAYSTILSFAFTNLMEKAWEFTHKSFGEALAAEAIGSVLEEIAEPGKYGESWRLPLQQAAKIWIDTFGPHYLTLDILDFCNGWIDTKSNDFKCQLIKRLPEVYSYLLESQISKEISDAEQIWDLSALNVLGNSVRSWFALSNSILRLILHGKGDDIPEQIKGSISNSNFRRGIYLSNIVSPITTGESNILLSETTILFDGIKETHSDRYILSLLGFHELFGKDYWPQKSSELTSDHKKANPIIRDWYRYYNQRERWFKSIRSCPLERAVENIENLFLHHYEKSVLEIIEEKLNSKGMSIKKPRLTPKSKDQEKLYSTISEIVENMIIELGKPPKDEGLLAKLFKSQFSRYSWHFDEFLF